MSQEKSVNEEKPKSGSDGGSQEGNSDESSESNLDTDSSEYRSDIEEMLQNGVLRDESDGPESSDNLPSPVGIIGSQYEREWLNKSENWEKFMNEKNGPRAKLFKKYGDYKGK